MTFEMSQGYGMEYVPHSNLLQYLNTVNNNQVFPFIENWLDEISVFIEQRERRLRRKPFVYKALRSFGGGYFPFVFNSRSGIGKSAYSDLLGRVVEHTHFPYDYTVDLRKTAFNQSMLLAQVRGKIDRSTPPGHRAYTPSDYAVGSRVMMNLSRFNEWQAHHYTHTTYERRVVVDILDPSTITRTYYKTHPDGRKVYVGNNDRGTSVIYELGNAPIQYGRRMIFLLSDPTLQKENLRERDELLKIGGDELIDWSKANGVVFQDEANSREHPEELPIEEAHAIARHIGSDGAPPRSVLRSNQEQDLLMKILYDKRDHTGKRVLEHETELALYRYIARTASFDKGNIMILRNPYTKQFDREDPGSGFRHSHRVIAEKHSTALRVDPYLYEKVYHQST